VTFTCTLSATSPFGARLRRSSPLPLLSLRYCLPTLALSWARNIGTPSALSTYETAAYLTIHLHRLRRPRRDNTSPSAHICAHAHSGARQLTLPTTLFTRVTSPTPDHHSAIDLCEGSHISLKDTFPSFEEKPPKAVVACTSPGALRLATMRFYLDMDSVMEWVAGSGMSEPSLSAW